VVPEALADSYRRLKMALEQHGEDPARD